MAIFTRATKSIGFLGRIFGGIFRLRIMFIFIVFLLLNSIIVVTQDGPDAGIKDLGKRLLVPTLKIQEVSLKIVEDGGLWVSGEGFFSNVWNLIFSLWGVITQVYITFFWISALGLWVRMYNDSQKLLSYVVGVVLFILVSVAYISILDLEMSPWITITAFKDFGRALPYIIEPITQIADKIVPDSVNATI